MREIAVRYRRSSVALAALLLTPLMHIEPAEAQISGMTTYYMSTDRPITQASTGSSELTLVTVNLSGLAIGEARLLTGKSYSKRIWSNYNLDTSLRVKCTDDSNPSGLVHYGQRGTNPPAGVAVNTYENWLFVRPTSLGGVSTGSNWTCVLVLTSNPAPQVAPPPGTILTQVYASDTYLKVSASETGARQIEGDPCASSDLTGTCKYVGSATPTRSVFDVASAWAALPARTSVDAVADVQITVCSYGSPTCYYSGSNGWAQYRYRLSVPQVTSGGATCQANAGAWSGVLTLYNDTAHHLPLHLRRTVPVDLGCAGSLFKVKFELQWMLGDPIKIDGVQSNAAGTIVRGNAILMNV